MSTATLAAQPGALASCASIGAIVSWQPTATASAAPTSTAAEPTTTAHAATGTATATAPPAATTDVSGDPPDTEPVLRPRPGHWGMTFIFGGLAPLSVAGLGDQLLIDDLIFTEIGVRRVFKRFVLPISFGAGVVHRRDVDGARPSVAAGIGFSIAILKGFRVWRRIAPYYGAFIHTHYVDAPGRDNWLVNLAVGPILGIEYFIAERVSLYGQAVIAVGPTFAKDSLEFAAHAVMAAGGQLGLTFYF